MHPFAMETTAILVHSLNRFSFCTKMAAVAVAKLLLCCDIICKLYNASALLGSILSLYPDPFHGGGEASSPTALQ